MIVMTVFNKMAMPRVLCRVRLFFNNDNLLITKYSTIVNHIPLKNCAQLQSIRQFRTNTAAFIVLNNTINDKHKEHEHHQNHLQHQHSNSKLSASSTISASSTSSSSSSDSDSSDQEEDDVIVEYQSGLPQITVPLPSRRDRCRFTLKPISNTVGDFLDMLQKEDKGIDRVLCKTMDGTRIASSTTIETLLQEDFRLLINDDYFNVITPKRERLNVEQDQGLNDVKHLVTQLYEALHIKEHQVQKENEIVQEIEALQQQLLPLEQQKLDLELVAHKRSNWMAWAGLGLMSVQFGILARLTWWEYSWDIMEPVTYFVTYGTAMACYAYFVLTREEYILNDVRNRQQLLLLHKKAKKTGFDLNQYNVLKDQIARLELDLKRLRDPLKLRVPQKPKTATTTTPKENSDDIKVDTTPTIK